MRPRGIVCALIFRRRGFLNRFFCALLLGLAACGGGNGNGQDEGGTVAVPREYIFYCRTLASAPCGTACAVRDEDPLSSIIAVSEREVTLIENGEVQGTSEINEHGPTTLSITDELEDVTGCTLTQERNYLFDQVNSDAPVRVTVNIVYGESCGGSFGHGCNFEIMGHLHAKDTPRTPCSPASTDDPCGGDQPCIGCNDIGD